MKRLANWLPGLCLLGFAGLNPMLALAQTAACVTAQSEGEGGYAAAQCALERRAYREALRLLEGLLRREENPIYRADLGRAYLGVQEFERARVQFLQALASNPPDEAKKLLRVFLQMAEQQQTQAKEWFASASLGWIYDSNINTGPVSSAVTLFGLPFTLAQDGLAKSDRGLHGTFAAVHIKPLTSVDGHALLWQTDVNLDAIRYQTYGQYDTTQLAADTGPHIRYLNDRADLYLPFGFNRAFLNSAGYTWSHFVSPQWTYAVGQKDLALISLPVSHKSYDDSPAMDNDSYGLVLAWRHLLDNNWTIEPSLRYGEERATDVAYSNRSLSGALALRGSLPASLRLRAEASYSQLHFLGTEFWADAPRRDSRINYLASLTRDLDGGYYVTLSWQRMRTISNLDFYRSERSQLQLQVSKSF